MDNVGSLEGKYEVLEKLHEGGMGAIYKVRHRLLDEIRVIKVMCSGRVEPDFVLKAFREGADAVFVAGCLEKNCHHLYGNIEARKRVDQAKGILDSLGLDGERLELFNLASNQGREFKESMDIMIERVERLGPNPLGVLR